MRKETIIKYEKEFLAWCKGESVLLGVTDPMHDRTLIWREVRDFNDWKPLDTVYVLNDSYSIYRKALAEGKSIQMLCRYDKMEPIWDDMTEVIKSIGFVDVKENYRIKPEEPKFKVGDWVVNKTSKQRIIKKVTSTYSDSVTVGNTEVGINVMLINDLELWKPKKGEYCWFWNKGATIIILELLEIVEDGNRKYFAAMPNIPHSLGGYYQYCEPFFGTLPTELRN